MSRPPQGPFHAGELLAQRLAGEASAGGGIRDAVDGRLRGFLERLPFAVAGTEAQGWPAATVLEGAPGFLSVPEPRRVELALAPGEGDPVRPLLVPGAPLALLGIELATRRRARVNGTVARRDPAGLTLAVEQGFGNCPQYIHPRVARRAERRPGPVQALTGLDAAARATVGAADTFFVASSAGPRGADVSHRGGPAGFVAVDGDTLTIPDYAGNRYFQTLGNLVLQPRAALLFVDFATGDLLHLAGGVEVLWEGREVAAVPGAERLWRVRVERGWRRTAAVGLRWD